MIRAAAVLVLLAGLAWAASVPGVAAQGIETVRVRSGDHPAFSRLVVELDRAAGWQFGRTEGGYALQIEGRTRFDLSRVFDLIGRTRIAGVAEAAPGSGRMTIALACDCHAQVSRYRGSWIVIDITDGPPPAGSPFETALAVAPPGAEAQALALPAAARRSPPAPSRPAVAVSAPPAAETGAVAQAPVAAARSASRAATGTVMPTGRIVGPAAWSGAATASGWEARFGPASRPASPGAAGPSDAQDRDAARPEGQPSDEERLLRELARAAAQGLLDASLPDLDRARDALAPASGEMPAAAAPGTATGTGSGPALPPQLRIGARTSIDRDLGLRPAAGVAAPGGITCLPDDEVDIGAWGGPDDVVDGIATRRAALVGEFDQPDSAAVRDLARYYLHLGFGAEARAVLTTYPGGETEDAVLLAVAAVLDGDGGSLPGVLAGQAGCGGAVSLWSFLAAGAAGQGEPADPISTQAILGAFAALPPHLRRHLGPSLAERLSNRGDPDAATAVRDALARALPPDDPALRLLDAKLGGPAGGTFDSAALDAVMAADHTLAADAYELYLAGELTAERAPDGASMTAAALAHEIAQTDTGAALQDLALRALLAEGDFVGAEDEIRRRAADGLAPAAAAALWQLFADGLVRGAQDADFVRRVFSARDALAPAVARTPTAIALGVRLNQLGFSEEALRYLPGGGDEAMRIARAEALLATAEPAAALAEIADLEGPVVDRLRARGMLALGQVAGAARAFDAVGDAAAAERAALAAGEWALLRTSEDERLRDLAELLGGAPLADAGPQGAPSGAGPLPDAEPAEAGAPQPAAAAPPASPGTAPVLRATEAVAAAAAARGALAAALAREPAIATQPGN